MGELEPGTSSFIIRYNLVLNLWRPGDIQHLRRICASTLREYQRYLVWEQRDRMRLERLEMRYHTGTKKDNKKCATAVERAPPPLARRTRCLGAYPLTPAST